jgi:SOS-response transcriptional repressor LexA
MNTELSANTNLSHYPIVSRIGAGGWARCIQNNRGRCQVWNLIFVALRNFTISSLTP